MIEDAQDNGRPAEEIRVGIAARLRCRSREIEQAIYVRLQETVPHPIAGEDMDYQAGVRETIRAVVDYGVHGLERGPGWSEPIPAAAAAQARLAARIGVSLGTVLRRYVVGHGELGEFVIKEAEACGLSNHGPALHDIRRTQEALLEHVTAAIEHEYEQERERIARSPERRRSEIVQAMLSGTADPSDLAELDYDVHASWHVGMIATGTGAQELLDRLKARFGRRVLPVLLDGTAWAWVGGKTRPTEADIERASYGAQSQPSLGIGEPGLGIDGLRLTHDQARAALGVALRKPQRLARYADHRLLAAVLENATLAQSLRQKYLMPLCSQRDGGATLRHTLRTYIDLDCNASSAAEVLTVGRRAVKNRVRSAEKLTGSALYECLAELDVALRLDELGPASGTETPMSTQ
jgi:hypothetical protein